MEAGIIAGGAVMVIILLMVFIYDVLKGGD